MTLIIILLSIALLFCAYQWYYHKRQQIKLLQWLRAPDTDIPAANKENDEIDGWGEIYSNLHRLQKKSRLEKNALQQELSRTRELMQTLPDGVIVIDDKRRMVWFNLAAASLFNLNLERDRGLLLEQIIRHQGLRQFIDAAEDPQHDTQEFYSLRYRRRVFVIHRLPFIDGNSVLLARDVTAISHSDDIRRDFVANISHELRTPLTVISGFIEQLRGDDNSPKEVQQNIYQVIDEQANRMNLLVTDLLTLSRLEYDSRPPIDEVVDMPSMINSLLEETRALFKEPININIEKIEAKNLRGSSNEIRSVLMNLLSNAIRYGGSDKGISVFWGEADNFIIFRVSDYGKGIADEHLPRLTERFYRVDKGRSSESGGTGLGLSIVKHILIRHQGKLEADSTLGKGSRFSACFPQSRISI